MKYSLLMICFAAVSAQQLPPVSPRLLSEEPASHRLLQNDQQERQSATYCFGWDTNCTETLTTSKEIPDNCRLQEYVYSGKDYSMVNCGKCITHYYSGFRYNYGADYSVIPYDVQNECERDEKEARIAMTEDEVEVQNNDDEVEEVKNSDDEVEEVKGDASKEGPNTLDILRRSGRDLKRQIANRIDAFIEDYTNDAESSQLDPQAIELRRQEKYGRAITRGLLRASPQSAIRSDIFLKEVIIRDYAEELKEYRRRLNEAQAAMNAAEKMMNEANREYRKGTIEKHEHQAAKVEHKEAKQDFRTENKAVKRENKAETHGTADGGN